MPDEKSKLQTKLSPLIEGQVPDFIQADHPVFVRFLKEYYRFLESGQLTYTVVNSYVIQETTTVSYILEETDGERILTEDTAQFVNGETITGETSKATAKIVIEDSRNKRLFITSQQKFITGETFTGQTSGAQGSITQYRGNPIQNIQQLLEYADVDNTIFDFLDQMRESFMTAIPNSLATSVSKRKLLKNIKDLYAAKGTREATELFFRILLGEEANIFYPTEHMLRVSNGDWRAETTLRCSGFAGVSGDEIINQKITAQTSGATAIVNDAITFQEGTASVTELELAEITGTFQDGEIITANSTVRDVNVSFTVEAILSSSSLSNDGILHTNQEPVEIENLGNNKAELVVDGIKSGTVSEVIVDDAGSGYEVGDVLTFTTSESDTKSAAGFVSVVGGGIQLETGTLDDSEVTSDVIIIEDGTTVSEESFNIVLDRTDVDGANANDDIILDGTDATSSNAGFSLLTDTVIETNDTYGTANDRLFLEEDTFSSSERGSIQRVFVSDGGLYNLDLPTVTITTTSGTGAVLTALTNDIGAAKSINVKNTGFDYSIANPPEIELRAHFILKDVTGTFANTNTLTTHTGVVKGFDSDTKVLDTTFENVIRTVQEQEGTFNEQIALEQGTTILEPQGILLEDELDFDDGEGVLLETGSSVLLDGESKQTFNITMESGTLPFTSLGNLIQEDNSGEILLEGVHNEQVQHAGSKLLLDRYRENNPNSSYLVMEAGNTGDENDRISTEEFGNLLILNGTDSDGTDAMGKLLFPDETGDGKMVYDQTASGIDVGDDIIHENGIDFSKKNVTITDSSGASGTIIKADIASGTTVVATTSTSVGNYDGIESVLGEDLIRIQDSFFYQDYSYEVQIGSSLSSYINELKRAVHPAGFKPFGKVSIATALNATIKPTAAGVSGYVGDTETFSPILASTLENIFAQTFKRRLGTNNSGITHKDDKIIYETGDVNSDKMILDGSSSAVSNTTPSNISILLESGSQPSGYDYDVAYLILNSSDGFNDEGGKLDMEVGSITDEFGAILFETGDSMLVEDGFNSLGDNILYEDAQVVENETNSGFMKAETAHSGVSDNQETTLTREHTVKLSVRPTVRNSRNLLTHIATNTFEFDDVTGIQLENGLVLGLEDFGNTDVESNNILNEDDSLFLAEEGTSPLVSDNLVLNATQAPESFGFIVLNGTDSSGSNAGDNIDMEDAHDIDTARLITEDSYVSQIGEARQNAGEKIIIEENRSSALQLGQIGSFTFEDFIRRDKIIIENNFDINPLEFRQHILAENEQSPIALESGNFFVELEDANKYTTKYKDNGQMESSQANGEEADGILLEDFGVIVLDGTDASSLNAGDAIIREEIDGQSRRILTEDTGSLVVEDFSTDSFSEAILLESGTQVSGQDHLAIESSLTQDDDIDDGVLLEDGTGESAGSIIILNGTDSSSSDAGFKLLLQVDEDELLLNPRIFLMESSNIFPSVGSIPLSNFSLNSTESGYDPITHSSVIQLRDTGDIALEDATDTDDSSNGFLLEETNGDNIDLEGATAITP